MLKISHVILKVCFWLISDDCFDRSTLSGAIFLKYHSDIFCVKRLHAVLLQQHHKERLCLSSHPHSSAELLLSFPLRPILWCRLPKGAACRDATDAEPLSCCSLGTRLQAGDPVTRQKCLVIWCIVLNPFAVNCHSGTEGGWRTREELKIRGLKQQSRPEMEQLLLLFCCSDFHSLSNTT